MGKAMIDENEIRREMDAAIKRAKWQFREAKVKHLLWYLTEGRDKDDKDAIERATSLAQTVKRLDGILIEEGVMP